MLGWAQDVAEETMQSARLLRAKSSAEPKPAEHFHESVDINLSSPWE
jgi:hypothetical protein